MTPSAPAIAVALALAAGLFFAGGRASAQAVTVRSGDHAGYARLVFDFPGARPGWQLARDGTRYVLTLDAPDLRVDVGDVFRLVGRDRIADIRQDRPGAPVLIDLACDCHADAFDFRATSLVIDIRDGPPPGDPRVGGDATPPIDGALLPQAAAAEGMPGAPLDAPPVAGAILPVPWADGPDPDRRIGPSRVDGPGQAPPAAAPRSMVSLNAADALKAVREQAMAPIGSFAPARDSSAVEAIARQLGRASAQGLVEAPRAASPASARETTTRPPSAQPGSTSPARAVSAQTEPPGNIRILTGVDQDFAAAGLDRLVPQTDLRCLPDRLVAVGQWGDEARTGAEIARYRSAILDDADRPDPGAIAALARHYLFLTFGAEARSLLDSFPGLVPDAPVLLALADVIEARPVTPKGPLAAQADCSSQVALWSILAEGAAIPDDVATGAILATFSGLPLHLRRHLAPNLARAFEAAGKPDAARAALQAVTRAPGAPGPGIELAVALIGDEVPPDALLAAGPADAAEAALTILDRQLDAGGPVDDRAIADAAAFWFELRDLPLGPPLKSAEIRGLIANGDVRTALASLERAATDGWIDAAEAQDLSVRLLEAAAQRAADIDFVAVASALSPAREPAPVLRMPSGAGARAARVTAAARLVDLGFDSLAGEIAQPGDGDDPAMRLAAARRALRLGRPAAALEALQVLDTPEAALLEAEALSAAGRHREAADAFGRLGDTDRSESEALRARDWARLAPPGAETPLDAPADLLRQAALLRDGIEGLLDRASR